ncbi:hypothetical protein NL676_018479 [Syzygium grande]|nr:hypothetical protein NL676_018479 [Syzygium grande]
MDSEGAVRVSSPPPGQCSLHFARTAEKGKIYSNPRAPPKKTDEEGGGGRGKTRKTPSSAPARVASRACALDSPPPCARAGPIIGAPTSAPISLPPLLPLSFVPLPSSSFLKAGVPLQNLSPLSLSVASAPAKPSPAKSKAPPSLSPPGPCLRLLAPVFPLMAESIDDGEFWLPPQFLSDADADDDDDLLVFPERRCPAPGGSAASFAAAGSTHVAPAPAPAPVALPYLERARGVVLSPDLGSPVESVVGSTEEWSDVEERIADLTRKVARSTLEDDFEYSKGLFWSGSPKSTLCGLRSGRGCGQGSSLGSPNGPSQPASPPGTLNLLREAAGRVAHLRINDEELYALNGFAKYHKYDVAPPYSYPSISQPQPFQASAPFRHVPTMAQAPFQVVRNSDFAGVVGNGRFGAATAWPTLQQAHRQSELRSHHLHGSGRRAVFLGSAGLKRESAGTGVFLPRRAVPEPEPRKKTGSTVLIPAKVVQALNLNLDDTGSQHQLQSRLNVCFAPESDGAWRYRSNRPHHVQQRGNHHAHHHHHNNRRPPATSHEIRLPQEWTY